MAHWKTVTDAVHAASGTIVAQLCHIGRLVHPSLHGVQLHASEGYLIDQYLRESSNQRSDEYGGSIENRLRLMR